MAERIRSVLVVEDEFIIAHQLQDALEAGGFLVLGPAATVTEAIDLINSERPDAAVLDFNLGRENVVPVALHLRTLKVPYVLATAYDKAGLESAFLFVDALNFGKPTDLQRLVHTIRSL
ncbi:MULTISPECIES: response regulator [Rhizobium]|uniref:Response regulator n=1 Tax=Rhizobium phaseoli TaxID=396 RepID=A0A7X6FBB4_9HYPH|nr:MULTISPECIES: response regulator [Rhizobium]ANL38257.1 response regulator CheY-like domain-containing protein [Rhizobium phaseoli]ANM01961.1 response regulator CheY-like domain-containing protein [Rhizobium phaseoli]MDE8763816.1 response regulator [Rhizobium sp. CBK13]NKF13324.1 response regulator [Rhizobium phaseoli]QPK12521.1 response regulator [Rhizobium phaseoli]